MKTKILAVITLTALLVSACCDSFLDTENLTAKNDQNYYSTPEEANEALTGCYDALQLVYSSSNVALPVASQTMSDLCFGGLGITDGDGYKMIDEFDKSVSPEDLNMFEDNWKNYYKGVFRCNSLINKLDNVDWENSGIRNTIEAEVRFLRAYFYFDLVKMFGRVPLLTEPSTENVPQAEPDAIYTVIAEDLLFAVNHASTKTYEQIASTEHGHVTKWAAESMLARVFMYYTGYYGQNDLVGLVSKSDALGYVEDVITNSKHGLVDNYYDLWPAAATYEAAKNGLPISQNTYAGETNKEIVFAIKYTYTSDYNGNTDGNHWLVINGIRNTNWASNGYGLGWGSGAVLKEFYDSFDADDDRKEASIMAVNEEGIDYSQDNINDLKEYTGYFTKKYIPTCDSAGRSQVDIYGGTNFMIGQFQDYFCIRYSDVLLMAAELGSANAVDYVNQVRRRAGIEDDLTAVDKDIIYEERKKEFAFEGIWYWDLLRYDNTLQYAVNKLSYNGKIYLGGVEGTKVIDGNNILNTRGLFQIPYNQITLSDGVLIQNPGW